MWGLCQDARVLASGGGNKAVLLGPREIPAVAYLKFLVVAIRKAGMEERALSRLPRPPEDTGSLRMCWERGEKELLAPSLDRNAWEDLVMEAWKAEDQSKMEAGVTVEASK